MTDHLLRMAEFVKGAELAGKTDPHLTMAVASMDAISDPLEKLWFAGCYALTYNWPTAERIFLEWRPADFNQADFLMWSDENWNGILLRKERKAVFRKPFFAESAASYLAFARWMVNQDSWPTGYDEATEMFTSRCRYMGRYIAARWVEIMRRAFDTGWVMDGPRSSGAQHPRKALALMYPKYSIALLGKDTPEEVRISDRVFDQCILDLRLEYGLEVDYYTLHSLLCEYKQAVIGRKQYPGKSLDSEVGYFDKVYEYWGPDKKQESTFYPIRTERFPHQSLCEYNGWTGVREPLMGMLRDHDITWSDGVYNYDATTDFANPVIWNPAVTSLGDLMP
jgi:hypothetical protein